MLKGIGAINTYFAMLGVGAEVVPPSVLATTKVTPSLARATTCRSGSVRSVSPRTAGGDCSA